MFASAGPTHHDSALAEPAEIEGMQGMPQFHQHVIRDVRDIVDGTYAHTLEMPRQPLRGALHVDIPDYPAAVAGAKVGI